MTMEEKSTHTPFPTRPEPCAQHPSTTPRWSSYQTTDSLCDYDEGFLANKLTYSSSVDEEPDPAAGAGSAAYEKSVLGAEIVAERRRDADGRTSSRHRQHMAEMAERGRAGPGRSPPRHTRTQLYDNDEEEEDVESLLWSKGLRLVIFFSGPLALLSLGIMLYSLLALLYALLLSPLRLCTTRPTTKTRLLSLLSPGLNIHLRCIYAPSTASSADHQSPPLDLSFLLLINFLSPFLALGLAVWAWIVAIYWLLAAIVGNPDGLDGRSDGRELVLSTRRWWKSWLGLALGEE